MKSSRPVRFLLLAVALLWLPAAAPAQKHKDVEKIGQRDINKGSWNLYSLEREIELGRRLSLDVEAQSRLLRDPRVEAYVGELVQNLVRNSDARVPFTVKVIDSDELNAFALPGGFLFVNTGLILEAQTAAGGAGPLPFLKFKRNAEREADFLGLQYPYHAGYDPVALVDFLERLKEKDKEGRLAKIFSSHPMTKDRIKRAQKGIAEVLPPQEEYVVSTSQFDGLKAYLFGRQELEALYRQAKGSEPRLRDRTVEPKGERR